MLVEAGGYEFSEASQDFCRGDVIGDRYPFRFHEARLRQFGGTSGLWSGWVFPLKPSDFATELFHRAMRVAPEWSGRMLKRMGKEYQCCALIQSELEQFPLPENRVELDQRADALGVPIARLYWNKAQTERKTALTATRLLGEAMIEHDIGRLRMRNYLLDGTAWPQDDQGFGRHHMGGTRMLDSPTTGVVDKNCKVCGVDNLYVGGSSVFATGGHASPTYTIVKLAFRSGDHLASKINAA